MKATPPKVPPPRHLLEPQLSKAKEGAAFKARLARFERDMQLDKEDAALLQKLNPEVAELIMLEPALPDLYATRQRCRQRIRDPAMEDFLVQIKDLEDDCNLDPTTSARLRALPRTAIEGIVRHERHWTEETQRQQIQSFVEHLELVIEAASSSQTNITADHIEKALVAAPKAPKTNLHAREAKVVFPKAKAASKVEAVQISDDDSPQEKSKEAGGSSKDAGQAEAPKGKEAAKPMKVMTPLMRTIESHIDAHHHSDAFLKETREYVGRMGLNNEVMYILRMLSSTAAWGVMKLCSDRNAPDIQANIMEQVRMVNDGAFHLGHELLQERVRTLQYQYWTQFSGYPPGYVNPWAAWYQQARKQKKKEKKEKKSKEKKEKQKQKSKGSKRKADSSYTYTDDEPSPSPRDRAAGETLRRTEQLPVRRGTPELSTASMQARFEALVRDKEPPEQQRSLSREDETKGSRQIDTLLDSASQANLTTESFQKAAKPAQDELKEWLQKLDRKGAFLEYLPKIQEQYVSLQDLAQRVKVARPEAAGSLGAIDKAFWKDCDIRPLGHRLLFAKAIALL